MLSAVTAAAATVLFPQPAVAAWAWFVTRLAAAVNGFFKVAATDLFPDSIAKIPPMYRFSSIQGEQKNQQSFPINPKTLRSSTWLTTSPTMC